VIFWYYKGEKYDFMPQKEQRLEGKVRQIKRRWDKDKGAIVNVKGPDGTVLYQETDERLTTYGALPCSNRLTAQNILAFLPKSRRPYSTAYCRQRHTQEPWWLTSFVAPERH
jgi:hypothetical protein